MYPIQKGGITIGDLDLKYIQHESLRNLVSVVPQKIDLFAGNVIDNIAVGDFTPNMELIIDICKSLDSTSENYIQKAVERLRQENKTIIIIAHRLSTVINADEIVVLQKGNVLEQGNHKQLYAKEGHYYNLWQQQMPKMK